MKPTVIAIAAVAGGGKTTITKRLLERLRHSIAFHFDDYDFKICPDDIIDWVKRGSDPMEWDISPLREDLTQYITDQSNTIEYIVLDYPFARLHDQLRHYIDLTVFIDTPLDIAMARRLLRDYVNAPHASILNDMNHYIHSGRTAYLDMQNRHLTHNDLIVDGSLAVDTIVERIMERVRKA
jgi:uridine kinase